MNKVQIILLVKVCAFTLFFGGMQSAHFGHIKLNLSASNSNYSTDFYFNSNATLGLDPGYDAALIGGNPPSFSIYSHLVEGNTGVPFSIQALSNTSMYNVTIPLGVHASQGQEVTISIIETDMPDEIDIYLEDTSNNTFTLLNTNNYIFTASSNISGAGRFYLKFEGDALSTSSSSLDNLNIFSNKNEKSIVITGQLQTEIKVKLFDIHGRIMLSDDLDTANTRQAIDVSHLSAGIYIIELENDSIERRIQKLIIR